MQAKSIRIAAIKNHPSCDKDCSIIRYPMNFVVHEDVHASFGRPFQVLFISREQAGAFLLSMIIN